MNRLHTNTGRQTTTRNTESRQQRQSGFTLLEMLISMVVLAVFLGAAIPSFGNLLKNNRLEAEQMDLIAAIALARSEAAKRGVPVTLSALQPITAGNEFSNGWVVWVDNNGDGSYQAGTETIRVHQALSSDLKISATTTEIAFLPSGFRRYHDANGNVTQAALTVCDDRHNSTGAQITVLPSGSTNVNEHFVCQ